MRITLCYILLTTACFSQSIKFEQFTTRNGLVSDDVYNLFQDKEGYLWMFTNNGAVKYNGQEFKPVLKNLPFTESFIYSVFENGEGKKWVANSRAQVYEIIRDSAFLLRGLEKISGKMRSRVSEIVQLHADDSLNIYLITKSRSYICIRRDSIYEPHNLDKPIGGNFDYRIMDMGNALLPVFNFKSNKKETVGFFKQDSLIFELYKGNETERLAIVSRTITGPKYVKRFGSALYTCLYDKLVKIQGRRVSYIPLNAIILNFSRDQNGHLWVATYANGLFELNEKDSVVGRYFQNTTVNDVLPDNQNGLWVSTEGSGIYHCTNLYDKYYPDTSGLGSSITLLTRIGNHLFIGTAKGHIYQSTGGEIKLVWKSQVPNKALDLILHNGSYYLSIPYGLEKMKINNFGAERFLLKESPNAQKLLPISKDSLVYIHRKGTGLVVNDRLVQRKDVSDKTYSGIFRNRTLYIAAENGIFVSSGFKKLEMPKGDYPRLFDTLITKDYLRKAENTVMGRVQQDLTGNLWFCSKGKGLFILDSLDQLTNLSTKNGLPADIINSIQFSEGKILLSCNTGLYYAIDNGIGTSGWKQIFPGNVQDAISFKNSIYVATKNGLVILHGNRIDNRNVVNFNLAKTYINSVRTDTSKFSGLSHDEKNIRFVFDVISFSDQDYSVFYRLQGPTLDSGSVSGGDLRLQNLVPGNYILTAFPDAPTGRQLSIVIPFRIHPAFWQTTWFLILANLLAVLLLGLSGRQAFKVYKQRQEKRIRAEKLILEYKLVALKAQVNPHFVSNCLTAIQHLIINNKLDAAALYIAKFGFLVRSILNFSSRSLVTVKQELEITTLNIELEQLRFEKKFRFIPKTDPVLLNDNIYIPALILNPIIENAIWHGLLPLKDKKQGELLLEVSVDEGRIRIVVQDNGVGRKAHIQNPSNIRESKGIRLTEQRLANLNFLYNISSAQITYEDLYDDSRQRAGTRVVILLPMNLKPPINELD